MREAKRIENSNTGEQHGPWFDDMLIHVPVAIVMSAAAVESAVNEWAQDLLDDPQKHGARQSQVKLIQDLIQDRGGTTLSRLEKLCLYLGRVPEMGCAECENVRWLTEFRNHFMHFKPAWGDDAVHDGRLVQALKQKRVAVYAPYSNKMTLPYGFMTYGCAKWAIDSAVLFIEHCADTYKFADRIGGLKRDW